MVSPNSVADAIGVTVAERTVGRPVNDSPEAAKKRFLGFLQGGMNIEQSIRAAGRTRVTYEKWRREDPEFVVQAERVKLMRSTSRDRAGRVEFSEFSERFLGARVFPHMQNVVDLIEGRDPSWVHPSMTYMPGERDLIMVNMPPEHAKTTSVTINYVVHRIAMDPNIRVILVSKTQSMAQKMLFAIKTRLTHPKYADMLMEYAPAGGFDKDAEAWNQTMIYVNPEGRDSGEKDPTVQALGIRGHIYGARADLVVLDDCVDLTNAHEFEKQIDWIQSEVISRIASTGNMLVVGTRLASKDLYSELRDPARYPDETSPWTYLAMPAVLEFADDPSDWVTLWPRSNQPEAGDRDPVPDADGLFPKWDGSRLNKKRARVSPRAWSMVFMQRQVADDAIFTAEAVKGAVNGNRMTGLMPKGMVNSRDGGMDGLIVVAGLDPATTGHTAAVVVGLDPVTQKRHVLDIYNSAGNTPDQTRDLMKSWTDKYGIVEWRVEKNGFQGWLTQDRELNEFCAGRGALLKPHFTGANKADPDFGVASMTTLFHGWQDKRQLIELPSTAFSEAAKALVEQLVTWYPGAPKHQKTDVVMALWFTELACRDRVVAMTSFQRSHLKNPYATRADVAGRRTVSIWEAEQSGSLRSLI